MCGSVLVSVAAIAEEGTSGSSTDTLAGIFDPPMLRKIEASDGRRGDDFGAENNAGYSPSGAFWISTRIVPARDQYSTYSLIARWELEAKN
jgi:hypothetical protein